ncbi:MAG: hypothetical protein HGN29_05705 [Asgard group archaeon]|nr:hypothetical protein [Asgard group archaeon]
MKINKKIIFLILSFVAYLLLSTLIEPNLRFSYDYLIPWYAALYIVKGVPLYEQPMFKEINGEIIRYPYHLPIYIYFLAVLIFILGESFIAGKISLVIFIFCDALLLEHILKNAQKNNEEKNKILGYSSLIFLLNPVIIITTISGLFDGLPLLYLLTGIFFLQKINEDKNKRNLIFSILSGISIGIGFLTKVIPLIFLPVGFLWLLSKKKYLETISFSLSCLGTSGGFLAYLWLTYEDFKSLGLGWQVTREDKSFSFYYYVFNLEFRPGLILLGVGLGVISILIIYFLVKNEKLDFIIISGIFLTSFFIFYRVFYPHYLIWIVPFISYLGIIFINTKKMKMFYVLVGVFLIELFSIGVYYVDFFKWIILGKSLLITVSSINLICLVFFLVLFFINRKRGFSTPAQSIIVSTD